MKGNMLTYEGPENCDECTEERNTRDHCARYSTQLNQDSPMFEVGAYLA